MPQTFITKSSFIQGYDCPLRLKYAVQSTFASTSQGDDFLRMLADGGFQFEILVHHAWPGVPLGGYPKTADTSHAKTMTALRACLKAGEGVFDCRLNHHPSAFASRKHFLQIRPPSVHGSVI